MILLKGVKNYREVHRALRKHFGIMVKAINSHKRGSMFDPPSGGGITIIAGSTGRAVLNYVVASLCK